LKYNAPYGVSDPNAAYINGNPSTGTMGSIPPAASIEYPQRELVNFFADCTLVPDNGDLHQLSRSVQTGHVIYAVDTGSANIVSIALTPPLTAYIDGMHIWARIAVTNTGPSAVSVNGLPSKNIVRRGGAALQAGDMPGGYLSLLVYNGLHSNFELYGTGFTQGGFLPILVANTVLYVNAATGDDNLYDGTAAAISGPHGPFKTIMRAINETFKYGPSVYTMTINVAAGNYPENVTTPPVVGPRITINGAGKGVTVCPGGSGYHTFQCTNANQMTVQNLTAYTTGSVSGNSVFVCTTSATLTVQNNAIGSAINGYVLDALGGTLVVGSNDFLAGCSALSIMVAFSGGSLLFAQNANINHLGTCNCNVYASASGMALIGAPAPSVGPPIFVNPGFVNGQKFVADLNGVIITQGQSINWFPGTIAGVTQRGGQYG
jgi:hypothetical protein